MKFSKRIVPWGTLALSFLWLAAIFIPLFSSMLFPIPDLQAVRHGLEGQAGSPVSAVPLIERTIAAAGPLRRSVQVAYYAALTKSVGAGGSHVTKTRQATFVAWFDKLPQPLLLVLTRSEVDGTRVSYGIYEGELPGLIRGYLLPILVAGISFYFVKRKPAVS